MGKARTRNQMQAPSMKALNATVNPLGLFNLESNYSVVFISGEKVIIMQIILNH